MIKVDYRIPNALRSFLGSLGPAGRHNLFSAAAAAVCNLVRLHIMKETPKRHTTAAELGAKATGHLEKAARKTVFTADTEHGEVVIPAPGFGRAFHDVEITPTNSRALTIPIHQLAYGKRIRELQALGWTTFVPKRSEGALMSGLVMGSRDGEVVPLYVLKQRVRQKQDRTLLPSDTEINSTAARAMIAEIQRVSRKAS